jgi:peptide/nickel transport system substrate-binding protein
VGLLVTACGPQGQNQTASGGANQPELQANQPTIVLVSRGEPPSLAARSLEPYSGALATMQRAFNATLDYIDENENPHAYLAESLPQLNTESWRVLPNGHMETRYTLKPNLVWQDGQPLTADDFVFAWTVYSNPELGSATTPPLGEMESVAAPDARTVVIRWNQLYAQAGALDQTFQALPRHILEQPLQDLEPAAFAAHSFWTTEYVGLGPYRLTSWEPGAFIQAEAFPQFVLGAPNIQRIQISFIPDTNTAIANLLSGQAHFIGEFVLTATDGSNLEDRWSGSGEGRVLWAPVNLRLSVIQQRAEVADPQALLDVRVRQALAFGIDSESAARSLNAGRAVLTSTLTSPRVPFYGQIEPLIKQYPYDARRAGQLLEEAGYTKGGDGFYAKDGQHLAPGVWSSSGDKNEQEAAVFVDSLRRSGIDAHQEVFPSSQLRDAQARALIPGVSIRGGSLDYSAMTSEQIPSEDNRWHGNNRGGWSNATYDGAYHRFTNTLDRSQRIDLIGQMEKVFTEQVPAIAHYFQPNVTAHVAALKGPVAAQTPDAGGGRLYIYKWRWEP